MMKSRGFAWSMSDRGRRGLTLSWLVLFVLSILMQYGSLASPNTALAVHDDGLFELDGNAANGGTPGDDWAAVYGGTSSADTTQFIVDPVDDDADETFTGGDTKDDEAIGDWLWKHFKASQPKNDITHAFAASYTDADGHTIVYFGLNKYEADGNNFVGFWFVQDGVGLTGDGNAPGSPFVGEHVVGDILVLANYTNGGALADFDVFEWVGSGGDANAAGTLNTIASGVPCTGAPLTDFACGATNGANEDSPWPFTARDADPGEEDTFLPGTFFEGGIDLTALGLDDTCVSTFIAETRASQSVDATLSDFALGGFDTCGSVTIVKDAIPDDAQDFTFGGDLGAFSLDDDANATLSNSITFNQVDPGSYDVSELNIPVNWELTGLTCDDGSSDTPSTVDLGTATATINVDPVEDVTCTFTNTRYGRIVVVKQTTPDGASQSFEFDPSWGSNFNLTDGQSNDSGFLAPGTYTVSEVNIPAGWDLTGATCDQGETVDDIDLGLNETVTCTFNNRQDGNILVDKITDPSGSETEFEFDPDYGPNFFLADEDPLNDSGFLTPGQYSVVEILPVGWDLSSVSCSDGSANTAIDLDPGETVTCTFNNREDGKIIVVKQTTPDGSQQSFEFDSSYGANFFLSDGQQNDSGFLDPGTYSVAEIEPAGWDLTSATCSDGSPIGAIDLDAGEVVTCTFNNRQDGHIVVVKETLPNGSNQSFEFDPSWKANFNLTDGQSNDTEVDPGTYSVAEVNIPAGWDLTSATCDQGETIADITVGAGETVTCTFTNTQRGHIVVDKVTDPSGDPQSFSFTTGGTGYVGFSLTDAADPDDQEVLPGTYSVSETVPAGWDLTSATCDMGETIADITVGPGETVTCTFTNTKRGHIVVDKVTDPSGDPQSFSFVAGGEGYDSFSLTDEQEPNDQEVVPGAYSVSETTPNGWDLSGASCDQGETPASLDVEPGETVTCVFENTKRGTIIVEKQTSPDGAEGEFEFTGDAEGTISDDGTIVVDNLQPGTYTSTESDPTPDFDLTQIICDDTNSSGNVAEATATFELDPGETVTCTFWNTQRGTITIIKDAQPNDAQDFGFDISGFDGPIHFELDDDGNDANTLSNMEGFENVPPGDYSVTENGEAGWDLTDLDCVALGGSSAQIEGATADLTMAAGGSITCTYVNSKPSISIVKTAGSAADGAVLVQGPGPVTYSYLVTNTGPITLVGVHVVDDNGTASTADDFAATCPKTTLAAGESMTCTATVTVNSNRTNVATATGESEQETEVSDTDDAVVRVPGTEIDKSNNDADGVVGHGQNVTFTILVNVTSGPVTNAVVTDTLPAGQTYVAASQTSNPASAFAISLDGKTLTWTFASLATGSPAATITYHVTIDGNAAGSLTNTAQVCVDVPGVTCKSDFNTLTVPSLTILKDVSGYTGGTAVDGTPIAKVGDTLTYTLNYDISSPPTHNGVITDVVPAGLEYVAGSATTNAEFTSVGYNAATRTLTWNAPIVSVDGTLSFKVTVLDTAPDQAQPIVNVAAIDSDETDRDDDDAKVLVQEVLAETAPPTLPPTDGIDNGDPAPSNPGFGLMLALLALAGVCLVAGYLTPTPSRTRRQEVRRR
ncbi:MAG: hypothetical protein EPO36_03545 [Chloroflexota bacterium]|nr:MAG: hypothetical protein EPO36_03545 [Chloroflexota bacterium]